MRSLGLIFGVCAAAACLSPRGAAAQVYGNWTVGAGQGYVEHTVRNGPGNSFIISCDEGATGSGEPKKTSILIEIVGRAPPPKADLDVFVDGDRFQFFTDERGNVPTDCHVCSDNFRIMWTKLRKAKQMIVSFRDGRSATFKVNGAAKALEPKHCKTGFES